MDLDRSQVIENKPYLQMAAEGQKSLLDWVFGPLSERAEELSNLAPCPYAADAVLKKQVGFYQAGHSLAEALESLLGDFHKLNQRVAILKVDDISMSYSELKNYISALREKTFASNLWVMFDHPEKDEFVGKVNMSFDESALFFVQRLSDVCESADALKQSGYYSNWSPDYYQTVVEERAEYHRRLKASTT